MQAWVFLTHCNELCDQVVVLVWALLYLAHCDVIRLLFLVQVWLVNYDQTAVPMQA